MGLLADLGIDRFTKYRALRRLASAGLIKIKQHSKRSLEVTFLQKRGRTKWH
jgi:predicted transcriptional regulator